MSIVKCCFEAGETHDAVEAVIQKCTDPGCCCGCCSALRPRYKRLVDNIFPVNPSDGLVKSNMEKLTFYSLSSPEKVDRIGEYLFQKASRDINRRRNGLVIIAMEAMDQLLVVCHAQTLNLFVESFLKMVQKLLESTDPQLQILATQSFVRFANIEEDTPSYHRRYDFFVSKFSAMCHSNNPEKATKDSIRLAGIKGLQGVIRKTVSDDLVENIWEAQHMDKIVPSLLYNMQNSQYDNANENPIPNDNVGDTQPSTPPALSEACLRELVGRASFGHIKSVLRPVLRHFDLHKLWVPNDFAIHIFRIIMFSIQTQYSHTVVETLMTHLDDEKKSPIEQNISILNITNKPNVSTNDSARVRTAVAEVLAKIIAIAAGESVGPSVLQIINCLLTHLRASVTRDSENETDEKQYQEALINALGEFTNHLPDYQKIDIMMFIMSKVPSQSTAPSKQKPKKGDIMLQSILLKSLLKVGSKYKTTQLTKAFPISFLEPLLKMTGAPGPETRILVQRILHQLIDRRHNLDMLSIMSVNVTDLELNLEKSTRPDLIFIHKHGPAIYSSLFEGLQIENNTAENIEAIYTTLALLCVELASEETVSDMLQFVLGVQQLALTNRALSRTRCYQLHALAAALLVLIPYTISLPPLADYAKKIIEARVNDASHLLPSLSNEYEECQSPSKTPYLMIDQLAICECLKASGIDPSRLQSACPYTGGAGLHHLSHYRHSWVEAGVHGGRDSIADLSSTQNTDVDSVSSSPGVQRQKPLPDELTFESMLRVLTDNGETRKKEKEEHERHLARKFRTASFHELQAMTRPQHDFQDTLTEIFNIIDTEPVNLPLHDNNEAKMCTGPGEQKEAKDGEKTQPPNPKRYGRIVLTLQNCLLPRECLEKTPSQADGLDAASETDLRTLACELLQTAGILLRLPQVAMATGQVYLQRFYYSKSFVRYSMEAIAMGSIYLASKVEEKPVRIRDVINVFHHIKQVRAQKPISPIILDSNYVELKNQVIKAERRILKELGFCVHVKHPHKLIVVYLQLLTYEKNKQLMQMSWNYMNDALRTDVFMRYQPETIACACIYLTARKIGLPLPNNPHWFSLFSVKEEDIADVCVQILKLYGRPKVNAEELERKIEDLRRIYQANKTINTNRAAPTPLPTGKPPEAVKERREAPPPPAHADQPSGRDEKREKSNPSKSTTPPPKHHARKYKHESRRSRSPYERKDRHKKRSPSPRRSRTRVSKHHHRDRSRSKDRDDKRKY